MNLNDLETFVYVAEAGSFAGAAERLGVPRSTVSRRVTRLEDALGRALLQRSARSVELTADGRALHERCAAPLREIAAVERGLGDLPGSPRGSLVVSTSIDLGASDFVAGLLAEYSRRYTEVQVNLQVTNRMVDLLEEQIDLAFRVHTGPLPDRDDMVARSLGRMRVRLYAHPDYLAQRGRPATLDALAEHRIIAQAQAAILPGGSQAHLTADDFGPVGALAAAGAGVAALPEFVASPYEAQGRLVCLDLPWSAPTPTLSLVWLRSRHLAPRVRAMIDLALEQVKTADWLQ